MYRCSVLTRCVLSICLVLNGLGTGAPVHAGPLHAAAASKLAGQPHTATTPTEAHMSTDSADASAAAKSPCHGNHASPVADDSPPANEQGAASNDDGDSLPECCRHAACAGACLQHSPAVMVLFIPLAIVTTPNVISETSTPPALPKRPPLTRPPDA